MSLLIQGIFYLCRKIKMWYNMFKKICAYLNRSRTINANPLYVSTLTQKLK